MGPSETSLETGHRQDCGVQLHRPGTAQIQGVLLTRATMGQARPTVVLVKILPPGMPLWKARESMGKILHEPE